MTYLVTTTAHSSPFQATAVKLQLFSEVSHSSYIRAISDIHSCHLAINHRVFRLATGAVIPVLVKAETIYANPPPFSIEAAHGAPLCALDPTAATRI